MLTRIGLGFLFAVGAMAVAAALEVYRKSRVRRLYTNHMRHISHTCSASAERR
jgi:hypothetical protein